MDVLPLVTFVVALAASIISGISGGGGGLIISPYLLLIGLPPQVAVATPKLAGLGLALGSLQKFANSKIIQWAWIKQLLPISLASGVIGPLILINTSQQIITYLVVVLSIMLSLITVRSKAGLQTQHPSSLRRRVGYFSYTVIAIAQAAYGSGIGGLLMFVLMGLFGLEALSANATKRLVGLAILVPSSIIFFRQGLINIPHGVALFAGMYCGGWIGAHIAVRKGNSLVRTAFAGITILTAVSALVTKT